MRHKKKRNGIAHGAERVKQIRWKNNMRITVGSKNKAKVSAVAEIIKEYPHLRDAMVIAIDARSGVGEQPKSLDETIRGAMNRARAAFKNCQYSFGIESGLIAVPHTKHGYMDVCACMIYDGHEFHLGLSSAFEPPKAIVKKVIDEGMNLTEACCAAGYAHDPTLREKEGVIGILTKGKLNRKEYSKQAIRVALIHLEPHGENN